MSPKSIFEKKGIYILVLISALCYHQFLRSVMSPSNFWLTTALSIGGIAFGILILIKHRLIYAVIKTLPRDVRGAWRFSRVLARIRWADKHDFTVAKFLDANADANPNKVCFYFEEQAWTYKQVQTYSNQIGNYFSKRGFKKGDTIALFMENRPEFVCLWLGLNKIGAVAALVNCNLRMQPLAHSLEIVNAKGIIYGHELSEAIQELHEEINGIHSEIPMFCSGTGEINNALEGSIDLDIEMKDAPITTPPQLKHMKVQDSLYYIYTSGTTGMPKAAVIKQYRLMMAANGVHFMNQVTEDDILYCPLPLFHMTGGLVGVGQALLFGTTVVIRKKFSASQFWKDCIKYNITVAQYLGETCRYLLAQSPTIEEKQHKVRIIVGNGLRHEIWQEVVDRFGLKEVGEVYGSTEGNCNVSNIDSKVGSVGFVPRLLYPFLPMTLIRVDERTGEPIRNPKTGLVIRCQPNEPGELCGKIIKQHPIRDFQGYTDESSTKKKILFDVFAKGDQAFRTGDILQMDEFGYFYFKDRTGDTFRWKGENVSTTQVESIVSNYCNFRDTAVYGVKVPNTEGRAGMIAISDPDDSLDLDDLVKGMTKSLPAYARPLFLRVSDYIDTTTTFKIRKIRLQDEGYNINTIKDKIYFLHDNQYVLLTQELVKKINCGAVRL